MENNYEVFADSCKKMGLELDDTQLNLIRRYAEHLVDTNLKFNLTAITDEADILTRHFLDSFTLYPEMKKKPEAKLLDVGSGGGFPGLALSIIFPDMKISLLEATGKKTTFLKETAELLGRKNVEVYNGRCEDYALLPEHREQYDFVTARALARAATLLEYTLPFTKIGGRVIALKKGSLDDEIQEAMHACHLLGGELEGKKAVTLPEFEGDDRFLVIYLKKRKTSDKYPRRNGIPSKLPLL